VEVANPESGACACARASPFLGLHPAWPSARIPIPCSFAALERKRNRSGVVVQAMAQAPAGEPVSTDREGNSDVRFGVVSLKLYSLEALLNGVDFK